MQRLPRLVGVNRAREISLLGRSLDASTAHQWGLVNEIVPASEIIDAAKEMAAKMASYRPEILQNFKRVMLEGLGMSFAEARKYERTEGFKHYRLMPMEDFDKMKKFIDSKKMSPVSKL